MNNSNHDGFYSPHLAIPGAKKQYTDCVKQQIGRGRVVEMVQLEAGKHIGMRSGT